MAQPFIMDVKQTKLMNWFFVGFFFVIVVGILDGPVTMKFKCEVIDVINAN